MSKTTKNDRIAHLEFQVTWLTSAVHELQGTENPESEPQLKQLDQSVFDGLDERWRFAAVSSVGAPFVYDYKPTGNRVHFSDDATQQKIKAGKVMRIDEYGYDTTDWQNSLIERESKELTGSDLCRAMLGRSNEYVMCLVGDECEESAKNSEVVRVVCSRGADYFDDTTEDMWYFAVPINNQGEPLTASEVGL